MQDERRIFSLLEITQSLRSVIERNYTATYWIKAEIAKLNFYPRSGHCYPEMVEKAGNVVKAQMRATIWGSNYQKINDNFQEVVGEPIKEGITILFRASVSFHPVYGLSLNISEVEPSFTLGEMAREKQKTIERLKKEELFEKNKNTQLPLLPAKIAVISVETSKGYHDFLNIINNHPRKFAIKPTLFPAILQGEKAVETISAQLRIIRKNAGDFDAIAIIRGGGGDIGLNCYDSYQMAKEVAICPIPVISGIGHSTNETIVEMIAWANKITPTDVAYFLIGKFEDFFSRIQDSRKSLINNAGAILKQEKSRLRHVWEMLGAYTINNIQKQQHRVYSLVRDLDNASGNFIKYEKNKLADTASKVAYTPEKLMLKYQTKLNMFGKLISSLTLKQLKIEKNNINYFENKASLLEPEKTLKRGYSITIHNGMVITTSKSTNKGDQIETLLHKGKIVSTVKKRED